MSHRQFAPGCHDPGDAADEVTTMRYWFHRLVHGEQEFIGHFSGFFWGKNSLFRCVECRTFTHRFGRCGLADRKLTRIEP